MNKLTHDKRVHVVNCLIEGCSIRATVRMTGVAKKTVMRFLVEIGQVCADHQDRVFRNLFCRRIQLDELWGFNYCKAKNVTTEIAAKVPGAGDVWLWVAIDAETKLVPCWRLGDRDSATASEFVHDLAARLSNRVQLTSDGHRVYLDAVESAFGSEIDYAMLVKMYGTDREDTESRYSPAECIGCKEIRIIGRPDPKHISTSYVERQNWSVRTAMRRYTRLSNGFSRKIENHAAAVAVNYFAYNFIKIHRTLRVSPAMAAGVTDHLWDASELVNLLEAKEAEGERAVA
ncbi:MAG TPA: IS1 family transposase [Verrucomicrobiae bacterium]|nr:IS1 family transposase [Verrucomicrobiae bacterium]